MMQEFRKFPKIARLSRDCVITEKIDGTNASVWISEDGEEVRAGKRTSFVSVDKDNFGFAKWVEDNKEELKKLGPGVHYGEWWGVGIQRGYGLSERRFSLFNTHRWSDDAVRPKCCSVVPVLCTGLFNSEMIGQTLMTLKEFGSKAVPGFMKPEGIVIFHTHGSYLFKKTIENDEKPKGDVK